MFDHSVQSPSLPVEDHGMGILVLTPSHQALFRNLEAARLITQINRAHGTSGVEVLPLEILSLCMEVKTRLRRNNSAGRVVGPTVTCLLEKGPTPIRLRGLGITDGSRSPAFRILILLNEEHGPTTRRLG